MNIRSCIPYFSLLAVAFYACNNTGSTNDPKTAEQTDSIHLVEKVHNFGTIKKTDTLTYAFEFVNMSEKPVVIKNVKPSCGCTTAEYSKDPVKKGEKGTIQVAFAPKSTGYSKKSVVVETNFDPPFYVFYLEGTVVGAE